VAAETPLLGPVEDLPTDVMLFWSLLLIIANSLEKCSSCPRRFCDSAISFLSFSSSNVFWSASLLLWSSYRSFTFLNSFYLSSFIWTSCSRVSLSCKRKFSISLPCSSLTCPESVLTSSRRDLSIWFSLRRVLFSLSLESKSSVSLRRLSLRTRS